MAAAKLNGDARIIRLLAEAYARGGIDEASVASLALPSERGQVVRLLQDAGARFDVSDSRFWRLLEVAAAVSDDVRVVGTLAVAASEAGHFQNGAIDPFRERDDTKMTALMWAVIDCDDPGLVRCLVDHGVPVSGSDRDGRTALMYAAGTKASAAVIRALLDMGADVDATDSEGRNALMHAASSEFGAAACRVLGKVTANVNVTDSRGNTALHLATQRRDRRVLKAVRALLASGAAVNVQRDDGRTPLMLAFEAEAPQLATIVDLLLSTGVDVDATDDEGRTALMYAARSRYGTAACRVLSSVSSDVNAKDSAGQSALHLAAQRHDSQAVRALLASGGDVNAQRNDGMTPLMLAVQASSPQVEEVLSTLLGAGADTLLTDRTGHTALSMAQSELPWFSSRDSEPGYVSRLRAATERAHESAAKAREA